MIRRVVLAPAAVRGGGGGHVVRCLALAQVLRRAGATCSFVVEPLGAEILGRLSWSGEVIVVTGDSERSAAIAALRPDAVVIDDYRLDARFEAALPGRVLVIDDLADRPHAAAILLDSGYGRRVSDYAALAPGAQLLLGPDYALLRDGFAGPPRPVAEAVSRVFVSFGLSDIDGVTARAMNLLRPLAPDALFDVALAADALSVEPLRALTGIDPGIRLHLDADVAPLMRTADLGIGAGGGMVWERRAAALPQLVVILADNQRPTVERLAADGVVLAVDVRTAEFDDGLASGFQHLLDPTLRRQLIDNPHARCDGRGAERAAQALLAD